MKCILEPSFIVKTSDLEEFIKEKLGFSYSVALTTKQTSPIEIRATGKFKTVAAQELADTAKRGIRIRNLDIILGALVQDESIPAGKYLIRNDVPGANAQKWSKRSLKIVGVQA